MRHRGHVQQLLPVSGQRFPLTNPPCRSQDVPLLSVLSGEEASPPSRGKQRLEDCQPNVAVNGSTAAQLHFNNGKFILVPPLLFNSPSQMHGFCIICIMNRAFPVKGSLIVHYFYHFFQPCSVSLLVTSAFSTGINVASPKKQACGIIQTKC